MTTLLLAAERREQQTTPARQMRKGTHVSEGEQGMCWEGWGEALDNCLTEQAWETRQRWGCGRARSQHAPAIAHSRRHPRAPSNVDALLPRNGTLTQQNGSSQL